MEICEVVRNLLLYRVEIYEKCVNFIHTRVSFLKADCKNSKLILNKTVISNNNELSLNYLLSRYFNELNRLCVFLCQSKSDCLLPWLVDRLLLPRSLTSASANTKLPLDIHTALLNTLHLVCQFNALVIRDCRTFAK